jgi:Domain of unknown function (DUF4105)
MHTAGSGHRGRGFVRSLGLGLGWLAVSLFAIWAFAALYFDVRIAWMQIPAMVVFALSVLTVFILLKRRPWLRVLACGACASIVLLWWLTLKPTNDSPWQEDVSQLAWAEVHGNQVVLHNVRNCDYRTEMDYTNCWSDRTLDLSQIRGADFFLTNWGIKWASHPIVSFQFGDHEHIAFSIEARYKVGQSYSVINGFFRQYGLIFIAADERDVIRLRTNYRTDDEEVYLYRVQVPPETARKMFLTYIAYLNKLKDQPEWYNELTRNCTSTIDKPLAQDAGNPQPLTYQLILNGTMDELLYNRNRLVTGGLPFVELKQLEHINPAAQAAGLSPDFSALIRIDRVGF